MNERKINGETVFEGKVFTVELDEVDCGGKTPARREVVRHPGGVAVLAVDEEDRVVMVRQFRYALGRELLELPAGKLEPGEDPMAAGIRELGEETGYSAAVFKPLGRMIPTGAYNTEVIHLYLAAGLTGGEAHPDEGEEVETELIAFEDALEMVLDGRIEDGKTAYGLMKYALTERKKGAGI